MKNPRIIAALSAAFITVQCAPRISGEFGSVRAPRRSQIAQINLKNGEEIFARKVQDDHDSLFMILLDYSPYSVAKNDIQQIKNRSMTTEEHTGKGSRPLTEKEKSEGLRAGIGCAAAWHEFTR